jgi:hypothetical protein
MNIHRPIAGGVMTIESAHNVALAADSVERCVRSNLVRNCVESRAAEAHRSAAP